MINYQPRAGSAPALAIAHLQEQPPGTELTTAVLAEAIGMDATCVPSCLEYAVRNGLLARDKRGVRIYWSLGDGVPAQTEDDDPIVQRVVSANEPLPPPTQATKRPRASIFSAVPTDPGKPTATVFAVEDGAASGDPRQLRIALWSDGQFVIERGDERIEFTRHETQQIVGYLDRLRETEA